MKTATRASKQDYRIQQYPIGLSEGSGVILELSSDDERTETNGSEKAGNVKAIEEIANKEIVDKEIADEEMADEEKAEDDRDEDADQAMNEQAGGVQAKSHVLEPAVPNPNSSLTLSSAECGNQFINANPDVSITDILKDTTEIEIQSMVDVPIYQEDPIV
ncbi:hypothetical protein Tco_1452122 [Tanacetum coccineum]